MELIANKFYSNLDEGKITGLYCNDCDRWVFPPVAYCRNCSSDNLEWRELSGEGELLYYSSSSLPALRFTDYAPYAYGLVRLKEGPVWLSMIKEVSTEPEDMAADFKNLPVPVKASIEEVAEMNIIVFEKA